MKIKSKYNSQQFCKKKRKVEAHAVCLQDFLQMGSVVKA